MRPLSLLTLSDTSSLTDIGSGTWTAQDLPPKLQRFNSNAIMKVQGHTADMERPFTPPAALALGLKYAFGRPTIHLGGHGLG